MLRIERLDGEPAGGSITVCQLPLSLVKEERNIFVFRSIVTTKVFNVRGTCYVISVECPGTVVRIWLGMIIA